MRRFVLLMVCLSPIVVGTVALAQVAAAQQSPEPVAKGAIYGKVIDQHGQPAKEIGLMVYPLGVSLGAALPHTRTDQNGQFRFPSIPWWGRYTVFASDEEAGYSLYSTGPNGPESTKEVTLSPEHPEAEFHLVLPPKAGFLEIHLTNRKTGEPIDAVFVSVMSADDPKRLMFSQSCASTRTILIPPDKDLLLRVTSPGFSEWARSAGNGVPLHMTTGSRQALDVELDPTD
jgi:5-hydroxyisourate hydrolase-like protein (transthyretin family)